MLGMPNIWYEVSMANPTDLPTHLLDLITPEFRSSVALAHRVRGLLVELHRDDGRIVRVSHDPAYLPVLSPCHLRLAVAQASVGEAPDWLRRIDGWTVGGPLVEPLGFGAVGHDGADGRVGSVATRLTPEVVGRIVQRVGERRPDDGEGFGVAVTGDAAMGATVLTVAGAGRLADDVDELTRWVAAACRHDEWARDLGRGPS